MSKKSATQLLLNRELRRLKRKYGLGKELKVVWEPKMIPITHPQEGFLGGEVDGRILRVYTSDVEDALHSLRHEFWEYVIGTTTGPLENLLDGMKIALEKITYENKERVIEALVQAEEESLAS